MILTLDVETTTKNKGHVFDDENFLVSYSLKRDDGATTFHYYTDPDFISSAQSAINEAVLVVGFNIKFDLHWLVRVGVSLRMGLRVFDCSLAEFILTGQRASMISLNECLEEYGLPTKYDRVKEFWDLGFNTHEIPVDILEEYNKYDVDGTYQLYLRQKELLDDKLYKLVMLEGADLLVLSKAERNGLKFNVEEANKRLEELRRDLESQNAELQSYLPSCIPDNPGFNWDSGDQLSALIYGGEIVYEYSIPVQSVYKSGPNKGEEYTRNRWHSLSVVFPSRFKPLEGSEVAKTKKDPDAKTKFYQVDDPTLRQLKSKSKEDKRLLELLASKAKISKVKEMIESILKLNEQYGWDGTLHPQYNQNVARTGRLSSSKPNGQNFSAEIDALIISRYAD